MRIIALPIFFTLLLSSIGYSQSSMESFGRNRIQHKSFDWKFISTYNFDVYYYDGGKELAEFTAAYAESEFERVSNLVGFTPYSKIKLIVYLSPYDQHQSNIGIEESGTFVGGHTNFVKSRAEIAFEGNREEFKKAISKGMADVLISIMMYGGSLKDIVQSSYLLTLPRWFLEGAAEYIAEGWSMEMDNFIRDYFLRKNIKNPSAMEGKEAIIIGQSIWNYIARKYGDDNIANILNLTRIIRDEEESIESTFGISYRRFLRDWENYYRSMIEETNGPYVRPKKSLRVAKGFRKGVDINSVSISPRGEYLAYTKNNNGKYKVRIKRLNKFIPVKDKPSPDNVETEEQVNENYSDTTYSDGDPFRSDSTVVANDSISSSNVIADPEDSIQFADDSIAYSTENTAENQESNQDESDEENAKIGTSQKKEEDGKKELELSKEPEMILVPTKNHKTRTLDRGGSKALGGQHAADNIPLVNWRSPNILSYVVLKKGKPTMKLKNIKNGKKAKIDFSQFDEILSYDFSSNGKNIIISASRKGQSDIFIYSIGSERTMQITNDKYDDLYPHFLKGTSSIVFSSNRVADSLELAKSKSIKAKNNLNIFKYYKKGGKKFFEQLTKEGNNIMAIPYDHSNIFFLSDRKGINNLYRHNIDSNETYQVTNFLKNINAFSLNKDFNSFAYSMVEKGKENVYFAENFDFFESVDRNETPRKKILSAYSNKHDDKILINKETRQIEKEEDLDINEFRFESDIKKQKRKETLQKKEATVENKRNDIKYKGPYTYKGMFSVDKVISTLMIDPLRSLGLLLEGGMSDMFGNHKINSGIFLFSDFKSSSLFGEYLYLKHLIDIRARFDRESYHFETQTAFQRYTLNRVAITGALPLSNSLRVGLTPFAVHTRFTDIATGFTPDTTQLYGGLRAELVYDNTHISGLNMIEGTRMKLAFEKYANVQSNLRNFSKLTFDLRHYQKIHKEIILATRFSHGQFIGNAKKSFMLGGMDNWLFNSINMGYKNNPLRIEPGLNNSDILFNEFVTTLRGFDYNTLFGPKYLLFNAELRVPLIRYLYNGTISSNFFRNLQFVGFTDIGTAWSGKNPFNNNNSINTTFIDGGDKFSATVTNFRNPFLIGYGMGARSMFLGYYTKLDVAWGLLDYKVLPTRFYLTFGFDF